MIFLVRNFNAKLGWEHILKPIIGSESLYPESNDNAMRLVNFVTSKDPIVKTRKFPHHNIQKYIHEKIKCRLEAGNSCYYLVQTLLSYRPLS